MTANGATAEMSTGVESDYAEDPDDIAGPRWLIDSEHEIEPCNFVILFEYHQQRRRADFEKWAEHNDQDLSSNDMSLMSSLSDRGRTDPICWDSNGTRVGEAVGSAT